MLKNQPFKKRNKFRFRKKKSVLKNRFFGSFILILFAFSIIFYLICFYSLFQIKEIEISGNHKVSTEEIENLVEINLPRKIIFLNSLSIFLIDLKKTEEEALNKCPQVERINFERDFPEKLIISIEERKPMAIFEKNQDYFFLDEGGIIFEKISGKDDWLIIKYSNFEREPKLGEVIIEKEKISKILKIQTSLKELKNEIISVEIVNRQRINVKTAEGWEIYFNSQDDISNQIFNLNLILKEKISPEERRNLEYIDLRFGNQVYYRER